MKQTCEETRPLWVVIMFSISPDATLMRRGDPHCSHWRAACLVRRLDAWTDYNATHFPHVFCPNTYNFRLLLSILASYVFCVAASRRLSCIVHFSAPHEQRFALIWITSGSHSLSFTFAFALKTANYPLRPKVQIILRQQQGLLLRQASARSTQPAGQAILFIYRRLLHRQIFRA